MIKSRELVGPSCLTNAKDDEPLFVLRANDELAPDLVREWAARYATSKRSQSGTIGRDLTATQYAKRDEALLLANAMVIWRNTHTEKTR